MMTLTCHVMILTEYFETFFLIFSKDIYLAKEIHYFHS